ncbi:MAG: amidohydrolase family protein [Victivallaceae bacterium]|nr:amidohydrolase family protein [Victivallaceae bacterium]
MKRLFYNCTIVDGTGKNPPYRGELLADDLKILSVGMENSFAHENARRIDCGGQLLAPAFIDAHGHSDLSALAAPECFARRSQGFATEICGNCGLSAFPVTSRNREHLQELYAAYGVEINWSECAEYRKLLQQCAIELIPLSGYNTLRAAVLGYGDVPATAADARLEATLLSAAFDHGSPGLSLGLLYVPGCFAKREELLPVLRTVAKYDRVLTCHLRSEGDRILEALDEFFALALDAGIEKVHISHLKLAGKRNWDKAEALLAKIADAQTRLRVTADAYPYTESMTDLGVIVPEAFGVFDNATLGTLLQSQENREKLAAMLQSSRGEDASPIRLLDGEFSGEMLTDAAARNHRDPWIFAAELLAQAPNSRASFAGISEERMEEFLALDYVCVGTDESSRPADGTLGWSHPRNYGTAPEFFRRLAAQKLPIEQIIWKMTGLPAQIFGLSDRGVLAPGKKADVVRIDPSGFHSEATWTNPHRPAKGVTL